MRKLSESDLGAFSMKLNNVRLDNTIKYVSSTKRIGHNKLQQTRTFSDKHDDHKHFVATKENLAIGNTVDKSKRPFTSSASAPKNYNGPAKVKQSSYFPSKIMRKDFFKTSFQSYNAEQIIIQTGQVHTKEGFLKETFNRTENKNDTKCIILKNIKYEVNSKLNKNKEERKEEGANTPIIKSTLESTQTRASNVLSFTLPSFPKIPSDTNKKLNVIPEPSRNSKRYFIFITLASCSPLNAIVTVIIIFHAV